MFGQTFSRLPPNGRNGRKTPPGLKRFSLAAFLATALLPVLAFAAPSIRILLSEPAGIHQEAANSLVQNLYLSTANWEIETLTANDQYYENRGHLIVTIGTKALKSALGARGRRPILALLVPQLTFGQLANGRPEVTALYLDQPLGRQLRLLGMALPELGEVGVLLGPISRQFKAPLEQTAAASGVQVETALIDNSSGLLPSLSNLAENSQAFLLLPDPVVAGRSTLQSFFLQTYRLKKPVLAYSSPLVQSGALLGLYATPSQQGEEAAGWIRESWANGKFMLGRPRHPKRFTVGINRTVARSLDIDLPSEEVLARELGDSK